jgi:hypothetical protein
MTRDLRKVGILPVGDGVAADLVGGQADALLGLLGVKPAIISPGTDPLVATGEVPDLGITGAHEKGAGGDVNQFRFEGLAGKGDAEGVSQPQKGGAGAVADYGAGGGNQEPADGGAEPVGGEVALLADGWTLSLQAGGEEVEGGIGALEEGAQEKALFHLGTVAAAETPDELSLVAGHRLAESVELGLELPHGEGAECLGGFVGGCRWVGAEEEALGEEGAGDVEGIGVEGVVPVVAGEELVEAAGVDELAKEEDVVGLVLPVLGELAGWHGSSFTG